MIINVHAGHNAKAPGASGLLDEVTEDRRVKDLVISTLRNLGHTVYDCTDNDGANASACLKNIVKKCNSHAVDLDVSIHFNAGAGDAGGNGRTTGTEVLVYQAGNAAAGYAAQICDAIAALGFKNRGVKARPDLYVLRHTKAPALLVECCFVDDADDARLYDANKMAAAIVRGITGQSAGGGTAAYTKAQFIREVQGAVGTAVDGITGPKTLAAAPTLSASRNRAHAAVKPVQRYLYSLGYTQVGEADGIAGAKFTAAVKAFQKDRGLGADGIVGAKTWKKLLGAG